MSANETNPSDAVLVSMISSLFTDIAKQTLHMVGGQEYESFMG